ncbi:MAG: hypothetical protein C0392_15765 [Syntrophus sp. (in: bacteria)]|nr:hypothetical protein [Syntrophus sp. (in: bacteria)]
MPSSEQYNIVNEGDLMNYLKLFLMFVVFAVLCSGLSVSSYSAETNAAAKFLIESQRPVFSVAISPDSKLLAAGHDVNASISIWDTTTGKELQTLKGHSYSYSPQTGISEGLVNSVAFSPDGTMLVSGGSDGNIIIWNTARWDILIKTPRIAGVAASTGFSPDGKVIAAGNGTLVSLWDVATGKKLKDFKGHSMGVNSIAFSPREKLLASGSSDRTIIVWDIVTGEKLLILDGQSRSVQSVDISPDGKSLISGGNYPNLMLWDLNNGALLKMIPSAQGMVMSVKYNPAGDKIMAGFRNGSVTLLDLKTVSRRTEFTHKNTVNSVAFSPDGKMVASGDISGRIILWSVEALGGSLAYPSRRPAQPYE